MTQAPAPGPSAGRLSVPREPLVVSLAEVGAGSLALVGGKAANLGELIQAGLPVPPGFCITTAAFDRFFGPAADDPRARSVAEDAFRRLDAIAGTDVAAARRAGESIRHGMAALPVPPAVAAQVEAAWSAMGRRVRVAVRSSATAEDLPEASFAGQQDTFLNVADGEALLQAVHRCWISLFTDRGILYRSQSGFPHREVSLAVIVQAMVDASVSGILFTADPVTGNRHIASIDAGPGLGEALVAGISQADLFRVDRRTGRVIEARVARKELAVRPAPGGGTLRTPLSADESRAPALTEDQAQTLVAMGEGIEALFGQPQDIEWSLDADGAWHILQSRPITTLFPLAQPEPTDGALHVYVNLGHVQVMTDAISPMGRSVLRTVIPFGRTKDTEASPWVLEAGGRLWVDFTPLLSLAPARRALPRLFQAVDELIAGGLARVVDSREFRRRLPLLQRPLRRRDLARWLVPALLRAQVWLWLRRPETAANRAAAWCDAMVEASRRRVAAAEGPAQRLAVAREEMATSLKPAVGALLPMIAGGMMARVLIERLVPGGTSDVEDLLRGLPGNVTTEMDLRAGDLADAARRDPALATVAGDDLPAALAAAEDGPFADARRAFLAAYGMRGPSEIDIARPRWRDDPSPLLAVVAGHMLHRDSGSHREHHAALDAAGRDAIHRLGEAARRGRLGLVGSLVVRRLARSARGLLVVREHPKFMIIRRMGLLRDAITAAAAALVARGALADPSDVWFLTLDELAAALEARPGDHRGGLMPLVARRRRAHQVDRRRTPPRLMTSDGEIITARLSADPAPEGALAGSPASGGVVVGRARIVLDPSQVVLEKGDILVAPFTDPGWTPIFITAAGLVMEVGGLMTHGSVVAREYGIPAVVGVVAATTRIPDGARIRVDGTSGLVVILEGDGGAEPSADPGSGEEPAPMTRRWPAS